MSTVNVLYGQDIFDLAIQTGYSIDNVYKLIQANSLITNINYSFTANPGATLNYDGTFSVPAPPQLTLTTAPAPTTATFKAIDGQTIFDIVAQTVGDLGLTYKMVLNNNLSALFDPSIKQRTFTFNTIDIVDYGFYNSLIKRGLIINTGASIATDTSGGDLLLETGFYLLLEDGATRIKL